MSINVDRSFIIAQKNIKWYTYSYNRFKHHETIDPKISLSSRYPTVDRWKLGAPLLKDHVVDWPDDLSKSLEDPVEHESLEEISGYIFIIQ